MQIKPDVVARPAGQRPPVIQKRPGDARRYVIDCVDILRAGELLCGQAEVAGEGVQVGAVRPRQGRFVEVEIAGGAPAAADLPLSITLPTTHGSIVVCVDVRVVAR